MRYRIEVRVASSMSASKPWNYRKFSSSLRNKIANVQQQLKTETLFTVSSITIKSVDTTFLRHKFSPNVCLGQKLICQSCHVVEQRQNIAAVKIDSIQKRSSDLRVLPFFALAPRQIWLGPLTMTRAVPRGWPLDAWLNCRRTSRCRRPQNASLIDGVTHHNIGNLVKYRCGL